MSINRGSYLRRLIKESEFSITEISGIIGVGRNTIYRWMDKPNLPLRKLQKVAQVIGVDISTEFPEILKLEEKKRKDLLEEERNDQTLTMKTKYMLLLEKHAQLLEELSELKEEVAHYKKKE